MKCAGNESESRDDRFPGQFFFVSTQAPAGPEKDEGFEEPAAVGKVTLHSLDYWVIDSGATYSMTPRADLLTELEPSPVKHVTSALGQRAEVKGMGNAMFKGADGKMVGLKNFFTRSLRSVRVLGRHTSLRLLVFRVHTYLLTDLGELPRSPPVLYVDNKAMLALCREQRLEHRTKHIALRYFLARELQQRGQLRLAYVASEANTADVFTKALAPCDHQRCCTQLGLVPVLPHLLTS
ncbi:unnamed protein product [Closterium sp. NIES-54]